jgi:glycerate dehydrogenase
MPPAPNIVFLDRATLDVPLRPPGFPHAYRDHDRTAPEDVAARLADAEIAITNKVPLREPVLARLPRLRMIAVAATGTDHIDKGFCAARGIVVANIRDYARDTVPEHVLALILALRRGLIPYDRGVRAGRWRESGQFCYFDTPIRDITGSTLGIIGFGALGRAVATRAEALGMRVLATGRSDFPGRVDLPTLLAASDIVTLHCPLTPQTRGLIGAAELSAMRPGAILINTARGGLVDEAALVGALRAGTIAGAGIDVLSTEPPLAGNPLLDYDGPNLILTPHVAWASIEAMTALADHLITNIEAFMAGTPRNVVTG